jgi:hypothetical protein
MVRSNDYMDAIAKTLGPGYSVFPIHTGGGCTALYVGCFKWHAQGLGVMVTDGDATTPGWPLEEDGGTPDESCVWIGVTGNGWAVAEDSPASWKWDDDCGGYLEIPPDYSRPDGWPDPATVARIIAEYGDRMADDAHVNDDASAEDIAEDVAAEIAAAYPFVNRLP